MNGWPAGWELPLPSAFVLRRHFPERSQSNFPADFWSLTLWRLSTNRLGATCPGQWQHSWLASLPITPKIPVQSPVAEFGSTPPTGVALERERVLASTCPWIRPGARLSVSLVVRLARSVWRARAQSHCQPSPWSARISAPSWLLSLGAGFALRARAVPGSIPGASFFLW